MAKQKKEAPKTHRLKLVTGETVDISIATVEALAPEGKRQGIVIRPSVIEALLVANSQGNRVAENAICAQIREMAEKQGYTEF